MKNAVFPRRVVITGAGALSPCGADLPSLFDALLSGRSGISALPELADFEGLRTRVAGLVPERDFSGIPRKFRRSMSRASLYAWTAAREALDRAGITRCEGDASFGLAVGSTIAGMETLEEFFSAYLPRHSVEQMSAMLFFRTMGHSVAANLAQAFGISGRVIAPAAACSTALQAVGIGYETVAFGMQEAMLCGGADEYHPLTSATFDIMGAASTAFNDRPAESSRPFDAKRDGIVCSEGAGMLLLESLDRAAARGASVLAEIVGFASNCDPVNMGGPDADSIRVCMEKALLNAGLRPADIDYINAHATGTLHGDAAECRAVAELFGTPTPPVSSLKGYLGHTMAAGGAVELAACLEMLRREVLIPTGNLDMPAAECEKITCLQAVTRRPLRHVMKNSFALGGVNCSVIIRKYHD